MIPCFMYSKHTQNSIGLQSPEVGKNIKYMLDLIVDKIYNPELGRQEVFFDRTWNSLIDLYSYGHDIETAWLVDRGLDVLDDAAYKKRLRPVTKQITRNIYDRHILTIRLSMKQRTALWIQQGSGGYRPRLL